MNKAMKEEMKPDKTIDLKVGEGFSDSRGYIPELGPIPKHNGLNINNEPRGLAERDKEKKKRQPK